MPHFSVEYSANLDDVIDLQAFCDTLKQAGAATGVFPPPGIRVRAIRCETYSIADGHPDNAFIDISIRLRGGRSIEDKKRATQAVYDAAEAFLEPFFITHPIALSLEMRDIDPELSPKRGSIRDHMAAREKS
jgi:5-carboxymethyl-2-hydroxymuconate isomerase